MSSEVKGYSTFHINGKTVMVIPNEYKGEVSICWKPDVLIISEMILNKYRKNFGYKDFEGIQIVHV